MYRKLLLKSLVFTLCLAFIISSVGCIKEKTGTKDDEIIKAEVKQVDFWLIDWGAKQKRLVQDLADEFNMKNEGIKVKVTTVPIAPGNTAYDNKLLPAITAGTPPDVILVDGIINDVVNNGIIQDITDLVENAKDFSWSQFYDFKAAQCKFNGKYYALPYDTGYCGVLLYNKDMFKKAGLDPGKPPVTLDELDMMAEKMYEIDQDGNYTRVGFIPWEWLLKRPESLFAPFGGGWADAEGNPSPTNPNNIKALEWMVKYVNKYGYEKVNKSLASLTNNAALPFRYGVLGMEYAYNGQVQDVIAHDVSFNWDIAQFPTAGDDVQGGWARGWLLAIPTNARNREGAFEFMKYFSGDEAQTKFMANYELLGNFSPSIKANEANKDRMPVQLQFFVDVIFPQCQPEVTTSKNVFKYIEILTKGIDNVLEGKKEPRASMDDVLKEIEAFNQEK